MSTVTLDVLRPVVCPHLHRGVCVAASAAAGVRVDVTPPVCNVTCERTGGPYQGRAATDPAGWAAAMSFGHLNSARKVLDRYDGVTAAVPAVAADVVAAFAPALAGRPWYVGLGLTGSAVFAGHAPRDLDVVVLVSDYRAWLDDQPTLSLPAEVMGLKVDLWARTLPIRGPFAVLRLDDLTLTVPADGYRITDVADGIVVVPMVPPADVPAEAMPADPTPAFTSPVATAPAGRASAVTVAARRITCAACPNLRDGHVCGVLADRGKGSDINGGQGIPAAAARCPDDPPRWGPE